MAQGDAPVGARAFGQYGTEIVGPYAGKKPLAFGTDNTFRVNEGQLVRVVDAGGNVVYSGIGTEGARNAVSVAQQIADEFGKNANFKIQTGEQTINPDGSGGPMRYIDVARANPQQSGLGFLADAVLPFAASFIPGVGPVLGAALGSTASSVAQGRGLQDALLRAGITAATAGALKGTGLGAPAPGSDAAVSQSVNRAINLAGANAATGAAQAVGQALSSAGGSALGSTAGSNLLDEIIVQATQKAAPSAIAPVISSAASNALLDQVVNTTPEQPMQQPVQQEYVPPPEEIIATATRQPASTAVSDIFPAVTGGISNTLLDQVINQPAQAEQQAVQQDQIPETIVTAPKSILPPALSTSELLSAAAAGGALGATALQGAETTQGMTPEETQDVTMTGAKGGGLLSQLTSGMGLTDYLTAASLLGSGISSLFGGGGGSTTAVPYVSPFGAGAGFGTGRDYRVSPGITDYERYGFGPEASFFAPEYSQLVSGAAGAPMQTTTGPQASTINPKYVPLI